MSEFHKHRIHRFQSKYMEEYEKKQLKDQRSRTALFRRLTAAGIVMFMLIAILGYSHIGQRILYSKQKAQYEMLQTELSELEEEEKKLKEEIDLLNDDTYILDIARTKYFLSKEGELIFRVD